MSLPKPAKLIISMFTSDKCLFDLYKEVLIKKFGEVDTESNDQHFNFTDYYEEEFGKNLMQKLFSFSTLIRQDELAEIKIITNGIENNFKNENIKNNITHPKRKINLDPGYITLDKYILASTKDGPSRIYLNQGIYAEITLRFINKSFVACKYTYPNYKTNEYINYLNSVRKKYKLKLRDKLIQEDTARRASTKTGITEKEIPIQ
ncbi:MAG TPA: DUF4416 family protein [Atribacterota bacterium]|nr:DUF4416 family protein [Atribacterota bacterium]